MGRFREWVPFFFLLPTCSIIGKNVGVRQTVNMILQREMHTEQVTGERRNEKYIGA